MSNRYYRGNRSLLFQLFDKQKGLCCYCNQQTIMPPSGHKGDKADNFATIEHVYSHLDIRRLLFEQWEMVKLSCNKCNNYRGKMEVKRVNDLYLSVIGNVFGKKSKRILVRLLKRSVQLEKRKSKKIF